MAGCHGSAGPTTQEPSVTMTPRQMRALAHPFGDQGLGPDALAPLRRVREHPRGWLTTILAVDR